MSGKKVVSKKKSNNKKIDKQVKEKKEIKEIKNKKMDRGKMQTKIFQLIKKGFLKLLNILKIITNRIKKYLNHPIHDIPFILVMIVMIITIIATSLISVSITSQSTRNAMMQITEKKFSIMEQLTELKKAHNYYTKIATKDERLIRWIMYFSDWKYQLNGDPKYGKADCVGAVYHYLRGWGSNMALENIQWLIHRANNLSDRGELSIRKNIQSVKSGDIIVIQLAPNSPSHLGIVYDTKHGWVQYMDMNAATMGMGINKFKFGSMNIYAIYSVSYSLWVGDLMQKINKI